MMIPNVSDPAPNTASMRLGFAVKVLGQEGLKSNDTRRWQNEPHLSVSLGYLRDIFAYLAKTGITMYRMSSDLAPYVTHPDMPQFHDQIDACRNELKALGDQAKQQGVAPIHAPVPVRGAEQPGPHARGQKRFRSGGRGAHLRCDGTGAGGRAHHPRRRRLRRPRQRL
jgi:hypothetical protein